MTALLEQGGLFLAEGIGWGEFHGTYTCSAHAFVPSMKTKIILTIDANLLREAKILAAEVRVRRSYVRARKRALARLRKGMNLQWSPHSRDGLHER